jgi:hypothetical protein
MGADRTHHNAHMKNENAVAGVRMTVWVAAYDFYNQMGINWDNIDDLVSPYEYGNTRFSEAYLLPFYFKNHFNTRKATQMIGYAGSNNSPLEFRLKRMNLLNFIELARALMQANMITKKDIQIILEAPFKKRKTTGRGPESGGVYKFYAKTLVVSSINKWGGLKNAARQLEVSLDVVKYWSTLVVKDIKVKPTSSARR